VSSYHGSGAIVVTSGSDVAIVESSFSDAAGLGAIRCYAAPIRVYGVPYSGLQTRRARVLRNDLLYLPWDGIQVVGVSEHAVIAGNRLNGNDLGVGIVTHLNAKTSVLGNVVSDGRNQGLYVITGGALDLVHNVFARMARGGGAGETVLVGADMPALIANNVYQSNGGGVAIAFAVSGTGAFITHETASSKPLVAPSLAAIDTSGMLTGVRVGLVVPSAGTMGVQVLPDSLLIDSGADVADRNGRAPRRFHGRGADRGSVELE
jgi:hypothetical protein